MSDADMVPRSRLNEEIARRKELEADLASLKTGLTAAEAKAAEAETLRAQLAKLTADHDTYRAGVEAGITDPEGLDLARYFYDKVQAPEGEERPSFADFMGKMKTDPGARPKALSGYFSDAAAPTPATTPAGTAPTPTAPAAPAKPATPRSTAPLPAPTSGAAPAPAPSPSAAGWTPEQIATMDVATYAANRDALMKQASLGLAGRLGGHR